MSELNIATLYAALSGPFKPVEALKKLPEPVDLAMEATHLADQCDLRPGGRDDLWLLRTPVRQSVLSALKLKGQLHTEVARRRNHVVDEATTDLLAVLVDEAPLSRGQIQRSLAGAADRVELERIILALDRAGKSAPSHDLLPHARAALAQLERKEKMQHLAERGFVGRVDESKQIAEWLKAPYRSPPVGCLFLSGVAGVGKSTLLGEAIRLVAQQQRPLILRLDFDRAGLDVQDLLGLTMEAARQLAEQLGSSLNALLNAREAAGLIGDRYSKDSPTLRQRLPEDLASRLGTAVQKSRRPVLVVLDTLEVLRGRGESHPGRLLRWLDRLVDRGVRPMCVLGAGRGDALDSLRVWQPERRVEQIELKGLEREEAVTLLLKLEVPTVQHDVLLGIAQGNPLKLRLGSELVKGGAFISGLGLDAEVSAAFLYRLLLSRITDPLLRKLAHPGLIVRRINARVIGEVLAPALGEKGMSVARAEEAFEHLKSHHWLVEEDSGAPGYIKHRSDMRALLLPLLYLESSDLVQEVDTHAMEWFEEQEQPWARLESLYHRLQLCRWGEVLPDLTSQDAALFDREMLEELPTNAADYLRNLRAERSSEMRVDWAPSGDFDNASIVNECLTVLKRQDWIEASYLLRTIGERYALPSSSPAADAVRTVLWRSGQWDEARRSLRARDQEASGDDDLAELPEELALARVEMRVEFNPLPLRQMWWQEWRSKLEPLTRAASAASDDCARDGALGLLLGNLVEPYYFASSLEIDSRFAPAINGIWLGGGGEDARLALETGRRRLARVVAGGEALHKIESGRVLATLTPYVNFVRNLSLLAENGALNQSAKDFAQAMKGAGGLFDTDVAVTLKDDLGDPLTALRDFGLFADWAQSCAFVEGNQDLLRIAQSAERWRRTLAGDWSIGRRQGHWARRPPLDQTTETRVARLLAAQDPLSLADEQIQLWQRAVPDSDLNALLRRRMLPLVRRISRESGDAGTVRSTTRQLLRNGVPAVFAPAVALLFLNAEP